MKFPYLDDGERDYSKLSFDDLLKEPSGSIVFLIKEEDADKAKEYVCSDMMGVRLRASSLGRLSGVEDERRTEYLLCDSRLATEAQERFASGDIKSMKDIVNLAVDYGPHRVQPDIDFPVK